MTRLLIIRHGQAICNVERTIESVATCRGLSPLGHLQAAAVAQRLRQEHEVGSEGLQVPMLLVTSPIRRAQETAAAIAEQLQLAVDTDADLEELRPGEAEGMTWDQYSAFYGTTEGWNPAVPFAPGAEAWSEFAKRVSAAIDRITLSHERGTVLLVTHGGVVDASVFHFFGLDPDAQSPIDFETTNASITEWERRTFLPAEDAAVHRWRLRRYNDAAHVPSA